jgi:hypothetical protein
MTFNEQNTIEQYVISKITGQKTGGTGDSARPEYTETVQWKYLSVDQLGRDEGEVVVEKMLKDALIRITRRFAPYLNGRMR